jgi:penicillin-binding protein 2
MNNTRPAILISIIVLIAIVLLTKLFLIQVADDSFLKRAERNAIQRVVDHPYRGLVYDRNEKLLVYNNPVFDLMVIPKEFTVKDTAKFCELFKIEKEELILKYEAARKYSWVKPSPMVKAISNEDFARIQDYLIDYPGLFVMTRSVRAYPQSSAANALGYIGEISGGQLEKDTVKYYRQGDYVGLAGLEGFYEHYLRGRKGVKYKMVNVRGVDKGIFQRGRI